LLRRLLALAVLVYLTADYSDPMVPGVFWFDTDSFFVESTQARPALPDLVLPTVRAAPPAREALEPSPARVIVTAPARVRLDRYSPRLYVGAGPSSTPESSEDH
jgi:hypothetical protein